MSMIAKLIGISRFRRAFALGCVWPDSDGNAAAYWR